MQEDIKVCMSPCYLYYWMKMLKLRYVFIQLSSTNVYILNWYTTIHVYLQIGTLWYCVNRYNKTFVFLFKNIQRPRVLKILYDSSLLIHNARYLNGEVSLLITGYGEDWKVRDQQPDNVFETWAWSCVWLFVTIC